MLEWKPYAQLPISFLLASSILFFSFCEPTLAQLSQSELAPITTGTLPIRSAAPARSLKSPDKQTLEDIFRRVSIRTTEAPALDLSRQFVPGLTESAVQQLGMNHFVVVTGTAEQSISQIYAENSAEGKCNFVTADSILHPYFGFANGMLGDVIEGPISGDLKSLLDDMIAASIADFRKSDDDEVKDDIQRNLAFLSVALRLLEPGSDAALPKIGGAEQLVLNDLQLVESARKGRSLIFGCEEDFSGMQPWGFMARTEKLRRFHLAYQWLSRMYFPLSNITKNTLEGGGNSFRRAVLLYRSLILARNQGEPPLTKWNRIASVAALSGYDVSAKRTTIIPPELSASLKSSPEDLDGLLASLSQPFLRTKLLLSVRKQKPLELNAKSIFEMSEKGRGDGDDVVFRFFPLTDPSELDWLREISQHYSENAQGPNPLPLGLFPLHAHGAAEATNLLAAQIESLDRSLATKIPRLERLSKAVSNEADQRVVDRHWAIVSCLFRPYPDTAQIATRSELFLARQTESSIAAWIDSYCAYNPIKDRRGPPDEAGPGGGGAGSAGSGGGSGEGGSSSSRPASGGGEADRGRSQGNGRTPGSNRAPQAIRPARFHYLEPRVELYKQLDFDLQNLSYTLTVLKVFPEPYRVRCQDFHRLFQRLEAIAARECKSEPMAIADFNLLANIDRVLTPVDSPVAANIYLNAQRQDSKSDSLAPQAKMRESSRVSPPAREMKDALPGARTMSNEEGGATIGIGNPARLFIVCNTSQGPMLARGGMYSYYEAAGGPIKPEHWQRKLAYGTMLPPCWARGFDLVLDKNNKAMPLAGPRTSRGPARRNPNFPDSD